MSIHAIRASKIRLYYVLAPIDACVLVQIGVSRSPVDRAYRGARALVRPWVLAYADMGGLTRARSGHEWLKDEISGRWTAQDGWWMVPEADGRTFRRCFLSAVHRYGLYDAKNSIHHVDLLEYSKRRVVGTPAFGRALIPS